MNERIIQRERQEIACAHVGIDVCIRGSITCTVDHCDCSMPCIAITNLPFGARYYHLRYFSVLITCSEDHM